MPSIADAFLKLRSDECSGFVNIELQSARKTLLGKGACLLSTSICDALGERLRDN